MKNIKTDYNRDHYYFKRDSKSHPSDFDEPEFEDWTDSVVVALLILVVILVLTGSVYD